jgi:GPH family glycoside/pentoside/hexuronide:cation symporter
MSPTPPKSLPGWKKLMYALGQLGWSLAVYGVSNLINFFYLPPESNGVQAFPRLITTQLFLGTTIVGLVIFSSRFADAIIDPIVASWSDRTSTRFGRRMPFMTVAAALVALFSFLMFFPPVPAESAWNGAWLALTVFGFYFFFTMYTMPYFALLSELAHTPEERLNLSTYTSVTWAGGFVLGNTIYLLKGKLEPWVLAWGVAPELASMRSFQVVIAAFAVISMIFMYLPVLFIKESEYCEQHQSTEDTWEAVKATFRNRDFRFFALSDLTYWVAMTTIQSTIVYYITVLLKLEEQYTTTLLLILFLGSFLFYAPVNILAKKFGKKAVLIAAFVAFSLAFALIGLWGLLPIPPLVQAYTAIALAAFPMATFGILPGAMVADIADADGIQTGQFRAGMFFATRTFAMKLGTSVATLFLPSLLLLGKSTENSYGVRLSTFFAFAFCAAGLFFILKVNEKTMLERIRKHQCTKIENELQKS